MVFDIFHSKIYKIRKTIKFLDFVFLDVIGRSIDSINFVLKAIKNIINMNADLLPKMRRKTP
jgi:hypothetical protein